MPGTHYTAQERALMAKLWAEGVKVDVIAHEVGRPHYGVLSFISENREIFPYRPRLSTANKGARFRGNCRSLKPEEKNMTVRWYTTTEVKRMAEMWANGVPRSQIAAEFGRSLGSLKAFMMAHRDQFPRKTMAELRKIDRAEVLRLHKAGYSITKIAHALDASYNGIAKALAEVIENENYARDLAA